MNYAQTFHPLCPECNRVVEMPRACWHEYGEYVVSYANNPAIICTNIYPISAKYDPRYTRLLASLDGFVKMDLKRIERLILLK
jgi:hypothetical protein